MQRRPLLAASLALTFCLFAPFATQARGAPRAASMGSSTVFVPCGLTGRQTLTLNVPIENAQGQPIARFSGGEATITVSGFELGRAERARIETGNGQGSFRVRGFVRSASLPIVTAVNVPVSPGHFWIGRDREVRVVGAKPDKLEIALDAAAPLKQHVTAWTPSRSLKLTQGTPPGYSPPGQARGYVLRQDVLALYDGPNGRSVGTLQRAPGSNVLFFSTEASSAWVHLEYHSDVVVDAWARLSDLSALPPGETMDQIAPPRPVHGSPRLSIPGTPRLYRTTHPITLRGAASDGSPPIGVVEAGTDTYVLDVMAGWVSVMPKALDVVPLDGQRFWVKKADLGL